MGDIGQMFPDTAEENRGRNSGEMLQIIWDKIQAEGYKLGNLDAVVLAQKPKLLTYVAAIRENIARLLDVPAESIGLKAKTGEGVGPVGEQVLLEVYATALIYRE